MGIVLCNYLTNDKNMILQTCEPGEDLNRIVVGIPVTG